MGITCKPTGKLKRMLKKVDNQREKEHKLLNKAKSKENKNS